MNNFLKKLTDYLFMEEFLVQIRALAEKENIPFLDAAKITKQEFQHIWQGYYDDYARRGEEIMARLREEREAAKSE